MNRKHRNMSTEAIKYNENVMAQLTFGLYVPIPIIMSNLYYNLTGYDITLDNVDGQLVGMGHF